MDMFFPTPPMAGNNHLDHAQHNHNVCGYLNANENFNDWTVVSAFYAALHYVSHKIFPIRDTTDDGHKFQIETIEEYINIKLRDRSTGKHYALVDLVKAKCNNQIASRYRRLLELSKAARYNDYNVEKAIADAAIKTLEEVKVFCQ